MKTAAEKAGTEKPIVRLAIGMMTLFFIMLGIAVARKTGWIAPEMGTRWAALAFCGMLALLGNAVPKLRYFRSEGRERASALAAERVAGRLLVGGALVAAVLWLTVAVDTAKIAMPIVQFAVFGGALAYAGWRFGRSGRVETEPLDVRQRTARASLTLMLSAMLGTAFIFLADAIWGDAAGQGLAIVIGTLVVLASSTFCTRLALRQAKRN